MASSDTLRARRRLVTGAMILAAVVLSIATAAYVFDLNLDDQGREAVEEHLGTNDLLGSVLAEQASLELHYDAVTRQTDGREEMLTAAFDPGSSLQLMRGLLTEHELLHARFDAGPDPRLETIEARFEAVAEAVAAGVPLSSDAIEQVTWRLLNFDLTSALTQSRQWHSEAFDVEAARISAMRSTLRIGLLTVLLVGGIVGAIVLSRLLRILRRTEDNEERAKAALEERHHQLQHALAGARAASEAKTRFVANTSHELRTPLTSIIGFAEILAESGLEPHQLEHLNHINSNAEHLLHLIDDVLDISRIESGEVTATRNEVDVVELLQQSVKDLRQMANGRPVEVATELPATAGTLVTDRVKLRQIVVNLVGNAIKFTEEGTVRISLQLNDDGAPRRIDVADTGIGIAPHMIEAIREPFRQADDDSTRRFGGAGLGIPISLGLADMLGFDLEIASELGVGSTFSLWLQPHPDQDAGNGGSELPSHSETYQERSVGPLRPSSIVGAVSRARTEQERREPAPSGGAGLSDTPTSERVANG